MRYYGIDLHSDTMTVNYIRASLLKRPESSNTFKINLYSKDWVRFIEGLTKEDKILIEASTTSYWFYDQVKEKVGGCYILNTNQLPYTGLKTDKIDAERLTQVLVQNELFVDPSKWPYIYVPTKEVRGLRSLFTTYQLHKKIGTQLKNRIHSLYKINGIPIDRASLNTARQRESLIETQGLSGIYKHQVLQLLNSLDEKEKEEKQTKELIIREGYRLFPRDVENLMSIKGFSSFTAVAVMSDICTIDRFANAKKLCSYLRSAPKVKSSNKTVHLGKTNKCGRRLTVNLMTQSMIHFYTANEHMMNFKERLRQGKSAGKVRMAVIRKVLTCVFHMLKKNEPCNWRDKEKHEAKIKQLKSLVAKYDKKEKEKKVA